MKKVQVPFYINIGTDEKPRKIPNPEYLAIRDEYTHFIENVVSENSKDIGIHMWYTRNWNSSELIHDMPNIERYMRVEQFINDNILKSSELKINN